MTKDLGFGVAAARVIDIDFVRGKATSPYGATVTSPIGRPARRVPGMRLTQPARPFRWEKPIPINRRNVEQALRSYTDPAELRLARWLYSTWNAEADAIKFQEIRNAVATGEITSTWLSLWKRDYADFVNDVLAPEWRRGWRRGGSFAANEVAEELGIEWSFPEVTDRMNDWVSFRGGQLISNLPDEQVRAVRELIRILVVGEGVGPRELETYIRPVIGLTWFEAGAVGNRRRALIEQGLDSDAVERNVTSYADFLLRRRAQRIARTETAFVFNFGQLDGVREMRDQGVVTATTFTKEFQTADDERVCPWCNGLDEEVIELDETFPGVTKLLPNLFVPPVHPNCRCTIIYGIVGFEAPAPPARGVEPKPERITTAPVQGFAEADRAATFQQPFIDRLSRARGFSEGESGEYIRAVQNQVEDFVKESDVYIRVPDESVLVEILDAGRLKSQHEVAESRGLFDPAQRIAVETTFGSPEDLAVVDRPIYGYLFPGGKGGIDEPDENAAAAPHYGKIVLKLKNAVRSRTTWVDGDSLNMYQQFDELVVTPTTVAAPSLDSINFAEREAGFSTEILNTDSIADQLVYFEAQIWGQVRIEDIDEVLFSSEDLPTPEILDRLDSAGVKWRIITIE